MPVGRAPCRGTATVARRPVSPAEGRRLRSGRAVARGCGAAAMSNARNDEGRLCLGAEPASFETFGTFGGLPRGSSSAMNPARIRLKTAIAPRFARQLGGTRRHSAGTDGRQTVRPAPAELRQGRAQARARIEGRRGGRVKGRHGGVRWGRAFWNRVGRFWLRFDRSTPPGLGRCRQLRRA